MFRMAYIFVGQLLLVVDEYVRMLRTTGFALVVMVLVFIVWGALVCVVVLETCQMWVWNIFVEHTFEKEMEKTAKNGDFCGIDYHWLTKKMQK